MQNTRLVPRLPTASLAACRSAASAAGSHLRAIVRIAGLLAISLLAGAAGIVLRGLAKAVPDLARGSERTVTRVWARAAARVIGMRVRVHGAPPEPPALLVANHLGYVDVIALWSVASGVFVAKAEVGGWPLVGPLGRILHTLFLDRGRKRDLLRVLAGMDQALASGRSVLFFAEGTSTRGDRVLPFKSSLFEAAVRARVEVACASLSYRTPEGAPPAELAVCWWGDMTFPDHVYALLRLPGFDADLRFADAGHGDERKALARRAHAIVRSGVR